MCFKTYSENSAQGSDVRRGCQTVVGRLKDDLIRKAPRARAAQNAEASPD